MTAAWFPWTTAAAKISEIEPPEPSQLWVQSKPAFERLHIDVVANRPRKQEPAAQDEAEGETDEDRRACR